MRAWSMVGVLVFVTLAGCSEAPLEAEDTQDTDFRDIDVQVDDQVGAILGVVVNDVIEPVVGATIILQGDERSTETDEQGRFVLDALEPGTYFLTASKIGHEATQFSTEVTAGLDDPPVVKVQLPRLFKADPFTQSLQFEGFFTCSQAGVLPLWSSSPCIFDQTKHPLFTGTPASNALPMLENATPQEREFHVDVGAGWQSLIWEMTWEPTTQGTSQNMGMTTSTYKPERCTCHWFSSTASSNPLRLQLDTGAIHETAANEEPRMIPADGIDRMSFFTSVRGDGLTPGLSLDQDFTIYHHQFYYASPPEGWSFLNGDGNPF